MPFEPGPFSPLDNIKYGEEVIKITLPASAKCLCKSELNYGDCCRRLDGVPEVKFSYPSPPGPATGHRNPKCFLRETGNCCPTTSREHYISKNILDSFLILNVSGMPWQEDGTTNRYTSNDLRAHILCKRHNNALSPIDVEGGNFFSSFIEAHQLASKQSLSTRGKTYFCSGEALEIWGMKLAAGLFHAKIFRDDKKSIILDHKFNLNVASNAFLGRGIAPPNGLYVRQVGGGCDWGEWGFAPVLYENEKRTAGVTMRIGAFEFVFLNDAEDRISDNLQRIGYAYRPFQLKINSASKSPSRERSFKIILTWPESPLGKRLLETSFKN